MSGTDLDERPASPPRAVFRCAMLLAGLATAPLGFRLVHLADHGAADPVAWRGLVLEACWIAAVCGLAAALSRRHRGLTFVAAAVWWLVHAANDQHVRALDAIATFEHAGYLAEPSFLRGSASAPFSSALSIVLLVATLALFAFAIPVPRPWPRRASLAGLGTLLATTVLWPPGPGPTSWRGDQVFQANARLALERLAPSSIRGEPAIPRTLESALGRDLEGEPRVARAPAGTNVLLLVLEGVSAAHLPSLAAVHDIDPDRRLPRLDALARTGLAFSTVVHHQRQTHRGLFALLCGRLPRLDSGPAQATTMATAEPGRRFPPCLADALREEGYSTSFLQSAPLAFMLKEPFLRRAGFTDIRGEASLTRAYARSGWGVDDRAFLEQALDRIDRLESAGSPWFLTLLTVGTHHPFTVPVVDRPGVETTPGRRSGEDAVAGALGYLDQAVDDFVHRLEARGVLERTVLVITSDESLGLGPRFDDMTRRLSQSWGLLLVRSPASKKAQRVDEPFAQSDLPLSLLDHLGLAEGTTFGGRSVFRRYGDRSPRPLFFANTHHRMTAGLFDDRDLYLCTEDLARCAVRRPRPGKVFGPDRAKEPTLDHALDQERRALLRAAQAHAAQPSRDVEPGWDIALLPASTVEVRQAEPHQLVMSGQRLAVPAGHRLEIDLELTVEGPRSLGIEHNLVVGVGERRGVVFAVDIPPLVPDDRLWLRYAVVAREPLADLEVRLAAKVAGPEVTNLRFSRARARLVPDVSAASTRARGWEIEPRDLRLERDGETVALATHRPTP